MSRAMELDSYHLRLERARARLFPPSKWAGLFPSAAYRRSAPPQLALGRLKWRRLGCFGGAWMASQRKRPPEFQNYIGLLCEPRGLLPSGGLYTPINRKSHQTREPRGLSPSGGKTPANFHVSLRPCAPMARSPGCSGTAPASRLGIWFRRGTFPACALRAEGRCRWTSRGGPACRRSPDSSCRPDRR